MNKYYEDFKSIPKEKLKSKVNELLKLYWPDFHVDKSEEEKEKMQEECRKIIEAYQMVMNGEEYENIDLYKEIDSIQRAFYNMESKIEYLRYMVERLGKARLDYNEWLKQQIMVKEYLISHFKDNNVYDFLSYLNDNYIKWLRTKQQKEHYEFYDWFINIGKITFLEERYIEWICGKYNEQNRRHLYNKYIKYLILNALGLNKDKKKLTFLDWLIELYGKKYCNYDKFVISK